MVMNLKNKIESDLNLKKIPVICLAHGNELIDNSANKKERISSTLKKSSQLFKELSSIKTKDRAISSLKKSGFDVEYIEEFGGRRFGAINIDNVRLIDNFSYCSST